MGMRRVSDSYFLKKPFRSAACVLLQEADPGPATKIANDKWLICPISSASSEITSENTGYLTQIAFN